MPLGIRDSVGSQRRMAPNSKFAGPTKSAVRFKAVRRVARRVALTVLVLVLSTSLIEHYLEGRAFRRLTASETFVPVRGSQIRYRTLGTTQTGSTVVFINGLVGSLEQWDLVQRDVADFAPTVTYDRGGFGFSQGSSAHSARDQADELSAVLTALNVDQPVVLVGFSYSASIARIFVSRHHEQVAGVVLYAPYLAEYEGTGLFEPGPLRRYARLLTNETVTTFLGVRRAIATVRQWRSAGDKSPLDERVDEILLRFPSWWALDHEWASTSETRKDVLEASPLGDTPLIAIAGSPRDGGKYRSALERLGSQSRHASLRALPPTDHGELLTDEKARGALVEAIGDVGAWTR
jgi:pimeloyl-ACP methyl ester carboxylesterase